MYLFVRASICLTFVMFEFYCSISWTACACMLIAQIFMKSCEKKSEWKRTAKIMGLISISFFILFLMGFFRGKNKLGNGFICASIIELTWRFTSYITDLKPFLRLFSPFYIFRFGITNWSCIAMMVNLALWIPMEKISDKIPALLFCGMMHSFFFFPPLHFIVNERNMAHFMKYCVRLKWTSTIAYGQTEMCHCKWARAT